MARRPANVSWLGCTREQARLLDFLDHLGNNGWAKNTQTEALLPLVLADCEEEGLTLDRVKQAMASVGYGRDALHHLDWWKAKRSTRKFGR